MLPTGPGRLALRFLSHRHGLQPWLLVAALVLAGCVHPAKVQAPKPTTVVGRVVHAEDANRGVPAVMVRAVGKSSASSTDSTGWFSLGLDSRTASSSSSA
jgi:hypothetical protein